MLVRRFLLPAQTAERLGTLRIFVHGAMAIRTCRRLAWAPFLCYGLTNLHCFLLINCFVRLYCRSLSSVLPVSDSLGPYGRPHLSQKAVVVLHVDTDCSRLVVRRSWLCSCSSARFNAATPLKNLAGVSFGIVRPPALPFVGRAPASGQWQ